MVLNRHYSLKSDEINGEPNCNFIGHLEKDADSCVAVTGCPGEQMELTIHSKRNGLTSRLIHHDSGEIQSKPKNLRVPPVARNVVAAEMQNENTISKVDRSKCSLHFGVPHLEGCKALPPSMALTVKVNISHVSIFGIGTY